MSRRVSLPGADELFRTTGGRALQPSSPSGASGASGTPGPSGASGTETVDRLRPVPAPAGEAPSVEEAPVRDGAAPPETTEHGGRDVGPAIPEQGSAPMAMRRPGPPAPTGGVPAATQAQQQAAQARRKAARANRRPSGRERHDEKITVYVSAEELMDLEHARLVLRGEHGLAVDRGRIVREAVAVVLADLESRGDASILVRRLRGR